jgi:hypothetical protein
MTTNHPYPKHIFEAVAVAILNHYNRSDGLDITAAETAQVALQALWEANQPQHRKGKPMIVQNTTYQYACHHCQTISVEFPNRATAEYAYDHHADEFCDEIRAIKEQRGELT